MTRGARRRTPVNLLKAAALATALLGVSAPAAQAKTSWNVSGTVANNAGSALNNCGVTISSGVGCLFAYRWMGDGSVDNPTIPTTPIPAGGTGSFGFTSSSLVEGGDMYIDYTMPTGTGYEVVAEDDDHVSGYTGAGNYIGCSQSSPQGDLTAVCSAQWGGTYEKMTPKITFGPSAKAPLPSVGQRCSGTMGGTFPVVIDCAATGQVGPPDPSNEMMITVRTSTQGAMYVQQAGGGQSCRLGGANYPGTCTMFAKPGNALQIGTLENATQGDFGVEIMATATGYSIPGGLPLDPNQDVRGALAVRGLRVSPTAVRPARSGAPVVRAGAAKGGGATIRYRSSHDATTVFSLARATTGVRRGDSCVRVKAGVGGSRHCTVWVTLPHQDVRSGVVGSGVKQAGRCRLAPSGKPSSAPCSYRSRLRGHFLHHAKAGNNRVTFTARLAGRRLAAGRYRVIAQSRYRRSDRVSKPVSTDFTIAR